MTDAADWERLGTVALGPGTEVRRCGFGTAWLTGPGMFGPPADRPDAIAVLRRAADAGVQLFDTADCYGPSVVEEILAEALHPYADGIVISTKGGRYALGDNRWRADAARNICGRPVRPACAACASTASRSTSSTPSTRPSRSKNPWAH